MLKLTGITKTYEAGDTHVKALRGIDIEFRPCEFVSVLGQSGCGKTTLLNIIGGLDRYTEGDLSIDGRSTKSYKSKDWDSYRNHRIGFIFQTYNLIPHQSVLSNVELALTLAGISKSERKARAIDALKKVGLEDQIYKKPNQMSGGQMQRVAIARALVNDPEIILADEPTGALDSETSVQIMDILKDISKDKLIIMVTHNSELAETYSTRIVRLLDGKITGDSMPYDSAKEKLSKPEKPAKSKKEKVSMSFLTALSLSFKNLMTKKGRTFLTAFAGSIGIIGIALILSLSNGFQSYIDKVQEDTISTYPIMIENEGMDMTSLAESMLGNKKVSFETAPGSLYVNSILSDLFNTMVKEVKSNSLGDLKNYFESSECNINDYTMDIKYGYDVPLNIYLADSDEINKVNPNTMLQDMWGIGGNTGTDITSSSFMQGYKAAADQWCQMIDNQSLLESQYDLLTGRWPQSYDEVVVVARKNYIISDYGLYALGLRNPSELNNIMLSGEQIKEYDKTSYPYEEIMALKYKLVLPTELYKYNEASGRYEDMSQNEAFVKDAIKNGIDIKVVGIIMPSEDAVASSITGTVGYTKALSDFLVSASEKSDIIKKQLDNKDTDIFTGLPFAKAGDIAKSITIEDVKAYVATLPQEQQAMITQYMNTMSEQDIINMFKAQLEKQSDSTLEANLKALGYADRSTPSSIYIYAKDFSSKDSIVNLIKDYNEKVKADGKEELVITYTDYVGLIMSSVSTIVDVISYVLMAFVGISLVVSSIMIGIITYISVLERTKEIGILRSIGASKKDISRVFNAETMIIGLVAGAIGIGVTLLLNIPICVIIKNLSGIQNVAQLPVAGGFILVGISVFLTFIAGLIPSRLAAKKDPVIALRSE